MKLARIIPLFMLSFSALSQTYSDVAGTVNVHTPIYTPDRWGLGVSFFDFNQDGWDDLTFAVQNDWVEFYVNNGGVYVPAGFSLYSPAQMRQILWVDYNNDDFLDLCVSYYTDQVKMFRNDGNFNFTDVSNAVGLSSINSYSYGISFGDYDNDGDLDLYHANYDVAGMPGSPQTNKLYNYNNGVYTDVTATAGVGNGLQASFMGVWFDYNEDNHSDLYVYNDRSPYNDALYENNGIGAFTDVTLTAGVQNPQHSPMSCSVSDYDNDGDQDVFLTEIASGIISSGVVSRYNMYVNQNDGTFVDSVAQLGLDTNFFAWGAVWVDYDNDSYEDLYIATAIIDSLLPERPSLLYRNSQGNGFVNINDSINANLISSSYCPVKGDINNDGFYDIVANNHLEDAFVLLNSGNSNRYVKITPTATFNNSMAIGTKVKVYANNETQYQTVFAGSGYMAQNSQHLIFGIGDSDFVDSVELIYPNGIIIKEYDLIADTHYYIDDALTFQVELSPIDTLKLCSGQSVLIGLPGYDNYVWNTGSNDSQILVDTPGFYYFMATLGINGLVFSDTLVVIEESVPGGLVQEIQPNCTDIEFGSLTYVPQNQTDSLLTVEWSNGDTGYLSDSLNPGWYIYWLESAIGCIYPGESVEILATNPFDVEFITTPYTMQSFGSVEFFTFGGTAPFQYYYQGIPISQPIDTLLAGLYEFSVIDATGCEVFVSFEIEDNDVTEISDSLVLAPSLVYKNQQIEVISDLEIEMIIVCDAMGRKVIHTKECASVKGDCTLDASNLSTGSYFYHLKTYAGESRGIINVH